MLVIRHDEGSVGCKGTINKLVIVVVCFNQMKAEIRIYEFYKLTLKQ